MKKAVLLVCMVLSSILLYSKDYYMEIKTYTKTDQKESSSVSKVWLAPQKMKIEQNKEMVILRNDINSLFYGNIATKKYLSFDKKKLFLLEIIMNLMLSGTHYKIDTIQFLQKDVQNINGWNCYKTRITVVTDDRYKTRSILTVWSAKKLTLDYSVMDHIVPLISTPFSTIKEFADKVEGFPVLVEGIVNVGNDPVHIKGELVKATVTSFPDKIFDIPSDYEEMNFNLFSSDNQ